MILGQPPHGAASGGYLDPELSSSTTVQHSGYRLQVQPGTGAAVSNIVDCNDNQTASGYYASAVAVAFGNTGSRSFATSQVGGIWQTHTNTAPVEPFGPPAEFFR